MLAADSIHTLFNACVITCEMQLQKSHSRDDGFSLIELLIVLRDHRNSPVDCGADAHVSPQQCLGNCGNSRGPGDSPGSSAVPFTIWRIRLDTGTTRTSGEWCSRSTVGETHPSQSVERCERAISSSFPATSPIASGTSERRTEPYCLRLSPAAWRSSSRNSRR